MGGSAREPFYEKGSLARLSVFPPKQHRKILIKKWNILIDVREKMEYNETKTARKRRAEEKGETKMERLKKIGKVPQKSASEVKTSRLGIGFEKLDRDVFDPNKAYDKVARLGVKWARIQSGWAKCEKEKGVYDFAWLDVIVEELLSRGLTPWLCLCYGNPLYTPLAREVFGAVGCPPVGSEEERAAWMRYVEATVKHFYGRITLFEIWNEPDCAYSWKHCFNEERDMVRNSYEYGEFARDTARVIRAVAPEAKICALYVA